MSIVSVATIDGVDDYNSTEIMKQGTETKWLSVQHDRREYPF
ncbi:hypothetical protein [Natrinema altunense]|nr:hypothetical protein [Natrinema altunense]